MEFAQAKRLFFLALIASLSATAALAIFFLLFAEFDETTERIVLTTALISLLSLFALPAGVLLDQQRYTGLAWTVITLSTLAFALAMALTWGSWENGGDEPIWKTLAAVAAFAAASSQAAMTTARRRPDDSATVRYLYLASLAFAVVLAAMVALAAGREVDDASYYRALGAFAIADVFLVIVQSVARRLPGVATAARPEHQLVFTLDRWPSQGAVSAASRALEQGGAKVERVERRA